MPAELHWHDVADMWILVTVANGAPVVARWLLGPARPLDFGVNWRNGRPLFGPAKTIRGLLCGIAAATLAAPLLGVAWIIGASTGTAAMAGDLLASFIKRRLGIAPSGRATGLDQIPESLLPALASAPMLGLNALDVVAVTIGFFVGEILLSKALYALHLRRRPY